MEETLVEEPGVLAAVLAGAASRSRTPLAHASQALCHSAQPSLVQLRNTLRRVTSDLTPVKAHAQTHACTHVRSHARLPLNTQTDRHTCTRTHTHTHTHSAASSASSLRSSYMPVIYSYISLCSM